MVRVVGDAKILRPGAASLLVELAHIKPHETGFLKRPGNGECVRVLREVERPFLDRDVTEVVEPPFHLAGRERDTVRLEHLNGDRGLLAQRIHAVRLVARELEHRGVRSIRNA